MDKGKNKVEQNAGDFGVQKVLGKTKPTKEDEYFYRIEKERIEAERKKKEEEEGQKERERLKELHFMRCPKCGMELEEIQFEGLLVDRCTSCSGVWLDHGELEALTQKEEGFLKGMFSKIFG